MAINRKPFLGLVALLVLSGCRPWSVDSGRPAMAWTDITPGTGLKTAAIKVFEGRDDEIPLRAWHARIDLKSATVEARIVVSDDDDGKESTSSLAADAGACLTVNAGYFSIGDDVARQIGLLVLDSQIRRSAITGIFRDEKRYEVARSALGFLVDGRSEIKWVMSRDDSVFAWSSPPRPLGAGASHSIDESTASHWPVKYAAAAGPSLISAGKIHVATGEEMFGATNIPKVHPRTAAGITRSGDLILLVVDGRQSESKGVDLNDLAAILLDLGAVDAVNLDGGGSSSFVVNGTLLNRPEGGTTEREIVSAISILCAQ